MRLRKIAALALAILLLCALLPVSAAAADPVFIPNSGQQLNIDGVLRTYEQPLANYAGYTLLPLRSLAADLGIPNDDDHIVYVAATKEVTLISADGARKVWLQQGNANAWYEVDGVRTDVPLDCLVQNSGGFLYIPVRFAAESLGMTVDYDVPTRTVLIRTPESLRSVDEILEKQRNADSPEKISWVQNMHSKSAFVGSDVRITEKTEVRLDTSDAAHIKMSMQTENETLGIQSKIEVYIDGDTFYLADAFGILKQTLSPDDMKTVITASHIVNIINEEEMTDMLRMRMFAKPGKAEEQTTLYGDFTSVFSGDSALLKDLLGTGNTSEDIKIHQYLCEITVDNTTGLTMAVEYILKADFVIEGLSVQSEIVMTVTYDYDPAMTVTIPQEIIDAAVEYSE